VPLQESAGFTLYRGRQDDNSSAVLAVALAAEQQSPQGLRRLEHEYSLAADLDPAWAAKPLALTRHEGQTVMILQDPGGEPLDRILERSREQPLDLTRFLRIAIGLTTAIGQVHRHGLIHKDIKPANVLVDGAGKVWLTGFGVASHLPAGRQVPVAPEIIAGTLAYMAPEQTGRMNRSARKAGKSFRAVNKKSLELLQSYSWPGNIRELQNVIERSVIVCETENFSVDESWLSRPSLATERVPKVELSGMLAAQEKEMIETALRESGGRVSGPAGAAAILGIHRSTLESKIASLNINKHRFKDSPPPQKS
jgi:serine/threonine protein kinase